MSNHTFNGDLRLNSTETFGPITNQRTVTVLSPDRFQMDQDKAVSDINARAVTRSTFLPDQNRTNIVLTNYTNVNGKVVGNSVVYPESTNTNYIINRYAHSTTGISVQQEQSKTLFQS